ncbi:hypothetical protein P3L10_019736 [Capsicum annuum]
MEKQREIEKGKANNFVVSFHALRKDVINILDFMERLKNEEGQNAVDIADQIEKLKLVLAYICTYVQLSHCDLEKFEDKMSAARQWVDNLLRPILDDVDSNVRCKHNMDHVLPSLMDNIDECISSCHHSDHVLPSLMDNIYECISSCYHSTSSAMMTDEQLNFLFHNHYHRCKYRAEQVYPLETQYEILQKVCGNMKDFHWLIVNGCVEHEIVQYVLPQFQLMAERVGIFFWNSQTYRDSRLFKLAFLLMKIIPIELEVMQICYTNLKASTSAEVGRFIKQLLETSPDILREYLIHLQEHMVNVIAATTPGSRNIHVMIEFLLIVLTDMPKDLIHHDKLFDLLARVGALIREVSTLVHDLEEKSRNEESSDETSRTSLDFLKSIELLKEDLKYVYMKAPDPCQWCFPMSDGPLFMHLLHIHLNDLLDSNAYSVSLIKEEIELVKEYLEFIRSFFVNVEQKLYKDLWARVLDMAYEAKDVIDSIISLIIEETNWLICKLTSGPKDLDVISITGMPGSGKTTLAYKVYHDKSVARRFEIRAWCTVGQEYDKRNLLEKVYNQVTSPDSKLSENIDVADKLRKQLYGKRYLIVLDDVWETDTWDKLKRPFPLVENGSRIILTTREMEVALHGKRNTDPLKLRLLKSEESWELLEKRAFGENSFPDELLDVGKEINQNCKGLPLVADLIAGVIAGREKKKSVWLDVRNNLNSFIFGGEVDVMKVIELSYEHLAHQLKPCLLYFARYPKDREMYRTRLKMLWRAEGLVEQTKMMSVEEVMEIYLDNLISSSLVISFNEIGDYPTCQLHDLVHDFCLVKAKEQKLFGRISSSHPSSSSDLVPRIVTMVYDKEHFGPNNFILFNSKMKRHSAKHLYSLKITKDEMEDGLSDACHLRDLRLLRVLILYPSFMMVKDTLLNEICMLNHLRFLRIGTNVKSLPSSFSNLWNLETLLVDNKGSALVLLPSIWNLVKLQVLSMDVGSFFDIDTDEPILIVGDSNGHSLTTNWLWDFHFPSNLKKLGLSDFPLASDSLSTIARLPNLEDLGLLRTIMQGGEWNMREEDTFENLKYLCLEEVTLAKWEFGDESFPMLKKLALWRCRKLIEIPPNFGDIGSLKIIQLVESPQLEDSSLKIKQYVEDMTGWDALKVEIF